MTFADDAGEYSIFVKNPHGEVSASASLLEEGTGTVLLSPKLRWGLALSTSASTFTEQYEAYMKQYDVTFKTEVTTTVIREPTVIVSQMEQKQITTPVSVVSEKVGLSGHPDVSVAKTKLE